MAEVKEQRWGWLNIEDAPVLNPPVAIDCGVQADVRSYLQGGEAVSFRVSPDSLLTRLATEGRDREIDEAIRRVLDQMVVETVRDEGGGYKTIMTHEHTWEMVDDGTGTFHLRVVVGRVNLMR